MKNKQPKTFIDLVQQVEVALIESGQFAQQSRTQELHPVSLKSMKLVEVRCNEQGKTPKVLLITDATFIGSNGPHAVKVPSKLLESLGISNISIGMGSFSYTNGTVVKGVSFEVRHSLLEGPLARELDTLTGKSLARARKTAIDSATHTKAYKKLLGVSRELEQKAKALAKQVHEIERQVLGIARQQRKLIQKALNKAASSTEAPSTKLPFEVVVG